MALGAMARRRGQPIMVTMSNPDPRGAKRPPHDDEVPVRTRAWCTLAMVPLASFMCMAQTSFASLRYTEGTLPYLWVMLSLFVGIASGFLLVARDEYPEATFWTACALVVVFPFDPLIALMAMSALLARRASRTITVRSVAVAAAVALYAQLRDALNPPDASLWHLIFARPHTGGNTGVPIEMLTGRTPVVVTAILAALIETAIAALVGLHIRSRAVLRAANAKADAAANQAQNLRLDLDNQQLADAIAAEAHDTLAHSLSLIALNASALQAESEKLANDGTDAGDVRRQASSIVEQSRRIRRQAAGALDEAHSIIDMLRHPEQAHLQLAPSDDTALTRESLESLMADARLAGMRLNTWIDIQQLSALDEHIGKIAYRTIQEGLTNARRHAPGAPVSLEVGAAPADGVHIHVSNPVPDARGARGPRAEAAADAAQGDTARRHAGAGLAGIGARARSVGGQCAYGPDDRGMFHVDVRLPWRPASGEPGGPGASGRDALTFPA